MNQETLLKVTPSALAGTIPAIAGPDVPALSCPRAPDIMEWRKAIPTVPFLNCRPTESVNIIK